MGFFPFMFTKLYSFGYEHKLLSSTTRYGWRGQLSIGFIYCLEASPKDSSLKRFPALKKKKKKKRFISYEI
jgi:hypothetical protein